MAEECYISWLYHQFLNKSILEHSGYFLSLLQAAQLVHFFSFFLNNQCSRKFHVLVPFVSLLRECVSHSLPGVLACNLSWMGICCDSFYRHHVSLCGDDRLFSTLFCSSKNKGYAATLFSECIHRSDVLTVPSCLPAEAGLQEHTIVNRVLWSPTDWQCDVFVFKMTVHLLPSNTL